MSAKPFESLSADAKRELLATIGVHDYLRVWIRHTYGTSKQAAQAMGMSNTTLCMMLSDQRHLSDDVLLAAGLKRVTTIELMAPVPDLEVQPR